MYLLGCVVVILHCLVLSEQYEYVASPTSWPRLPYPPRRVRAGQSGQLSIFPSGWPSPGSYPPRAIRAGLWEQQQESPTSWSHLPYPPRGVQAGQGGQSPSVVRTQYNPVPEPFYPPRYPSSGICERMICPPGLYCEENHYQCSQEICPSVAVCKAYEAGPEGEGTGGLCQLLPAEGSCRDNLEMWHWDASSRSCRKFQYSGCGGNANRFSSEDLCKDICDRRSKQCRLAPKTGNCRAAIPRFYYNVTTKRCESFIYGGCQANSNNFRTKKECVSACSGF